MRQDKNTAIIRRVSRKTKVLAKNIVVPTIIA